MSGWKIFLIILGCLVAVVLLAWLVYCLCKKHKAKKLKQGYATIGTSVHDGEISSEPTTGYKNHYGKNYKPNSGTPLNHADNLLND